MKTKKFSQKLALNKKTIANLNNSEMNNVKGKAEGELTDSPHRCTPCCPTAGSCEPGCWTSRTPTLCNTDESWCW